MAIYVGTSGPDNFVGGGADDEFIIAYGTLGAGDVLSGGGGFDTLTLQNAFPDIYQATISGIEALRFTNLSNDFNNLDIAYIYDSQFGAGFSNALKLTVPQNGSYSFQVAVFGANFSAANWTLEGGGTAANFNVLFIGLSGANTTFTGVRWATNTLWGNTGNDTLIGGDLTDRFDDRFGGTNTFRGGKGDDQYSIRSYSDFAVEMAGEGSDTVTTVDLSGYTLPANVENLRVSFDVIHYYDYTGLGNDLNNLFDGSEANDTFYGYQGNDEFHGGDGANVFIGGLGADRFYAEATFNGFAFTASNTVADFNSQEGDKIYIQSPGWKTFYDILDATIDTAAGATIRLGANTSITLQGLHRADLNASDFLLNGVLPTKIVPSDFSNDNVTDVLWGRTSGTLALWYMNNGGIAQNSSLSALPNGFAAIDRGHDFTGDGMSELLVRNATTGVVQVWRDFALATLPTIDLSWRSQGVGDFNGDRKSDVLWRHTNGDVSVWTMNNMTLTDSVAMPKVDNNWKIQGLGDFNGDGKTDVLWRHVSGQIVFWQMDGANIKDNQALNAQVDLSWHVAGIGDFDGDGKSDIVWRHNTGFVSLWEMNGYNIANNTAIANVDNTWKLEAIGDYNGDGKSDLLWRNNGFVATWQMDGSHIANNIGVGTVGNEYSIVGGGVLANDIV